MIANSSNDLIWFKEILKNTHLIEKLKKIKLIISDIDGCLTDANLYYCDGHEEIKGFSTQDGFATSYAIKNGLNIALISGKNGTILEMRAKILGIPKHMYHFGIDKDKIKKVHELQKSLNISKEETLFFGDDFLDIEVKNAIEIFTCPSNAIFYIQPKSDLIIPKKGGEGAFRLLLDLVLYVQNKHFAQALIEDVLK